MTPINLETPDRVTEPPDYSFGWKFCRKKEYKTSTTLILSNYPRPKEPWYKACLCSPGKEQHILEVLACCVPSLPDKETKLLFLFPPKLSPVAWLDAWGFLSMSASSRREEGWKTSPTGPGCQGLLAIEPCPNHIWPTDWVPELQDCGGEQGKVWRSSGWGFFCLEDTVSSLVCNGLNFHSEKNTDYWRIRNRGFGSHNVPNRLTFVSHPDWDFDLAHRGTSVPNLWISLKRKILMLIFLEEGNYDIRCCFG